MEIRSLSEQERIDWLRLARCANVGPRTFDDLIGAYESPARALEALPDLARKGGVAGRIRVYPADAAEREIHRMAQLGARHIARCEPDYPALLRHIDSCPPVLAVAGDPALLERPCVAIVGSRNASAAGLRFARTLAGDLADNGCIVVSGLARGIDTAAHAAALDGGTAAVIAGGIDIVYPPENEGLQHDIADRGVLLTEMQPGVHPKAKHFPRRNRLISGLSLGVVVIEAAERSGSLITARNALEQNRDVFAVPGSPLDPRAAGTNRLIRDGAALIRSADDVLEGLSLESPRHTSHVHLEATPVSAVGIAEDVVDGERRQVMDLLGAAPISIDDLIHESGVGASSMQTILLELDLAGRLQRHGNATVSLLH